MRSRRPVIYRDGNDLGLDLSTFTNAFQSAATAGVKAKTIHDTYVTGAKWLGLGLGVGIGLGLIFLRNRRKRR